MTSGWLGGFLGYMQPQFIPYWHKGEIDYELIKKCCLNREGNQYKGFSTQIENVDTERKCSGHSFF